MKYLSFLVSFLLLFLFCSCSEDLNQNSYEEEVLESRHDQKCCNAEVHYEFKGFDKDGCKKYKIGVNSHGYCDLALINVNTKETIGVIPTGEGMSFTFVLCDGLKPIETSALDFQLVSNKGVCETFNVSTCCDGLKINSIVVLDKGSSDCCTYKLFGTNSSECELVAIVNGQVRAIGPGDFSIVFTVCKKDDGLIPLSITSGGTRCYVFEPSPNVACWQTDTK